MRRQIQAEEAIAFLDADRNEAERLAIGKKINRRKAIATGVRGIYRHHIEFIVGARVQMRPNRSHYSLDASPASVLTMTETSTSRRGLRDGPVSAKAALLRSNQRRRMGAQRIPARLSCCFCGSGHRRIVE